MQYKSMILESSFSMKEAQERLGHSSIQMTMNIYSHLSQKSKDETVEKLAKFADFQMKRSQVLVYPNKKSPIPCHTRDRADFN